MKDPALFLSIFIRRYSRHPPSPGKLPLNPLNLMTLVNTQHSPSSAMPRLAPRLIWYCRQRVSPHAALILPVCRDLESAKNEVRWMREHLLEQQDAGLSTEGASSLSGKKLKNEEQIEIELFRLCKERAKGVPLQYVLGSQPFGELEVRCKKGVLIPR